jgi:hypothetical protein
LTVLHINTLDTRIETIAPWKYVAYFCHKKLTLLLQ